MRLKDYIQSNKRGKEANRLEREALSDPFMQDALEGFESVSGDHISIIEQLEKKYTKPAIVVETLRATSLRRTRIFYRSIAASILLLIGFCGYFFLERNKNDIPVVAEVQPVENEIVIPVDSAEPISAPIIEKPQQKPLIAQATKKTASIAMPTPAPIPAPSAVVLDIDESISNHSIEDNLALVEDYYFSKQAESLIVEKSADKLMAEIPKEQIVRGRVVDETGEPLIGVSIVEKGTANGTTTDFDGNFVLQLSKDDSSKLIATYLGYKSQEIKSSNADQTVTLKPDHLALSEVVVVGYGTQRKSSVVGAVTEISKGKTAGVKVRENDTFGEKEFKAYIQEKADKNVCDGQGVTVKVSFFIEETGKPSQIEFKSFSCEDAKKEIENLLAASPVWTKASRKVTMTIKW